MRAPSSHGTQPLARERLGSPAPRGGASLKVRIGCHMFRATGITAYLEAGGLLENARRWPHTTKLYDHCTPALVGIFHIAIPDCARAKNHSGS
jgi:hypothetical protein